MRNNIFKTVVYCFKLMYNSSGIVFIGHIFVSAIISLYALFNVNMLKYIIDMLTGNVKNSGNIYFLVGIYILSLILIEALYAAKKILWDYSFDKARNKYLKSVYCKIIKLPLAYIDTDKGRNDVDDVIWMADRVSNAAYDIWECISSFIKFCLVFSTLAIFDIKYTLIALLFIIPSIIANLLNNRKVDNLRREKAHDTRKTHYYRWMLTDIKAAKDVRMYNLTDALKKRYEEEKNDYLTAQKELDRSHMLLSILTEVFKYSGEIIFSLYVILQTIKKNITIGEMTMYIGYVSIASSSFTYLLGSICDISFNFKKQMDRVFEFKALSCGLECNMGKYKLGDFESLRFDNVYFKYPTSDNYILEGVSFTINKGDKVSLVGINGAGKSTIVKLMLGLYEIESGSIYINEHLIQEYDINDVRKKFSVLFQSYANYAFTLKENIGLSDLDRINNQDDMLEAMKQSGVFEFYEKFDNGFNSYITKEFADDGIELSQGQKQKLALCRTYFKNAQVVIFDEPSAALDAEAEDKIFQNFGKITDNKTGVMISHRISGAQISNKIIVLDKGKIAEIGSHNELINIKNGIYANLYNLQKEKYTIKRG